VVKSPVTTTTLERRPVEHFAFAHSFRRLYACTVASSVDLQQ
jgi:hypothetical protein